MIVKQLIDTTDAIANTDPEVICNLTDENMLITYELSGGTTGSRNIQVLGRIPAKNNDNPVTTGDTAALASNEWVALHTEVGIATDTTGQFVLSGAFPAIVVRISGNAGGARVRCWVAYNDAAEGL